MELKDVLHFYLGCEVMTKRGKGLLVSVAWEDLDCVVRIKNDDEESGFYGQYEDFDFSLHHIKPILRPLSSMAQGELLHVMKMCYKSIYDYEPNFTKISHVPDSDGGGLMAKETIEGIDWTYGLTISKHGPMFSANGDLLNIDPFEITVYLLSQYFDLFNLIPEGKAIDATSLTNQSLK